MKKGACFIMSIMLGVTCLGGMTACGDKGNGNKPNTEEKPDYTAYEKYDVTELDVQKFVSPIWDGIVSYGEAAFVMEDENKVVQPISLLYPVKNVVSVRSADLQTKYVEGQDFEITADGKLKILENGSIPYLKYENYYFEEYDKSNSLSLPANAPKGAYLVTETTMSSKGMSEWCLSVTYTHEKADVVTKPQAKTDVFSGFMSKLSAKQAAKVVYFGDSITDGWGSTAFKYVNRKPYCPMYADLAMDRLEQIYDTTITRENYSVSGNTSLQSYENEDLMNKVTSAKGDLYVVAFGMNDGGGRAPKEFSDTIKRIVNAITKANPNAEIAVVLSMIPNEKMGFSQNSSLRRYQDDYPEELAKCEASWKKSGKKVAVVNVTDVHKQMLAVKKFQDTTSSNSNHPNDYMHRVYAQVLLETMLGDSAF